MEYFFIVRISNTDTYHADKNENSKDLQPLKPYFGKLSQHYWYILSARFNR